MLLGLLLVPFVLWKLGSPDDDTKPVRQATAPVVQSSNFVDSTQVRELAATMLNLNGLLCAEVLSVRPLVVRPDVHEVTCIEYRGGSATKTYHIDTNSGKAWPA